MLLAAGWRVYAVVLLSLAVISKCDQCIRYEFHETALQPEGNSELLINDCRAKNSKVTDYNAALLQIYGPLMINITFNCCSSLPCRNDLQCPFNFNCNRGKCLVADCNLRDEMEIVEEENTECIIDEDCYFKIPLDKKHWSCLSETSECIHKEKRDCTRKCKRCAFVGDHWANFNNTIDVGLYNNESPSTSLINDLLPARNTSTPSPANSLLEFNLNSLINEPESDSGSNSNELRSEEGFSRLLDSNNDRANNRISSAPSSSTTTTSTASPPANRSSNRLSLSNDSFVNSTTVPNRFLNSSNITSILEFINSPANGRNVPNSNRSSAGNAANNSRLRPSTSRPDSSSGFTRNDLPTNIINELTRSSLEPSSSASSTTTSTTTTTTTTTTTEAPVSSSEESSNEANEANSGEFRLNSTIDDFLFTRTSRDETAGSNDHLIASNNRSSSSIDNNFINLFSSLFANNSSPANSSTASVNAITVPLALNSSSPNHFNPLASSSTRTNNVFNSPFNTLFNIPPSTTTSTTTSAPTSPTALPFTPSTSAVLSAASILNRSRSVARNNENNRFARRSSSSLRPANSGRSLLNNHRLIHMPNDRINSNHLSSSDLNSLLSNNNHAGTNGRIRRPSSTTTTTTTTTTSKPPSINSNNPYYHLASFNNDMLPGILYADFDITRIQPNTSVPA